jgi:zinc/manganese transport system permease protein
LLSVIYRPLVAKCLDPGFLHAVGGRGGLVHTPFLALVVLNLVARFQALGTLIAVGLMMLPTASTRFLGARVVVLERGEPCLGVGLRFSRLASVLPPRPALGAGDLVDVLGYLASLTLGPHDSLRALYVLRAHLNA